MTNPDGRGKKISVTDQLIGIIRDLPEDKQIKLMQLLEEWNLLGKRKHDRRSCLIAVDYSTRDRFFRDFIQDIGAGGVFIETRELLTTGQQISLTFSVPNSQIPFRITGEIARSNEEGIAVRFKHITQYQEEILKNLVEKM